MEDTVISASLVSKLLMSGENNLPYVLMEKNLKKSLKERPGYAKR